MQATKIGDEVGYVVPHDGSMKDDEMFRNNSMVELRGNIAKTMNAKLVFFVMDACIPAPGETRRRHQRSNRGLRISEIPEVPTVWIQES